MPGNECRALMLRRDEGNLVAAVETVPVKELPPSGEVLVRVEYSGLNYKDAMAIGDRGIIRNFPAVPGIDFAGVVEESGSPAWKPGDRVIATGWGLGERYWGGLAGYARAKAEWLTRLPEGMSALTAMSLGTAGFTAMLCAQALARAGCEPGSGEVLVTGASGGVGSVAVAVLAKRGYRVVAMSGKPEAAERLTALGASRVVGRGEYATPSKPGRFVLEPEAFAGAVDTVGGATLASVIARTAYGGAVAACGLAGGAELDTHVFPFIVRGVSLLGIDSVRHPAALRPAVWERLAVELDPALIGSFTRIIALEEAPAEAARILSGGGDGRAVVKLGG